MITEKNKLFTLYLLWMEVNEFLFNILRPKQNGLYHADNILKDLLWKKLFSDSQIILEAMKMSLFL